MWNALLGLYLATSVFAILHEMDSIYWKEWELFKMKGGITAFLLLHLPLLSLVLIGLILVYDKETAGLVFAIVLATSGIAGFSIHIYFIMKGHTEFTTGLSLFILWALLLLSLIQLPLALLLLL